MKKKIAGLVLSLVMCMTLCAPAFATGHMAPTPLESPMVFTSQEEADQYLARITRDTGEAKVERGTPVEKTASGYPGNQPRDGAYYGVGGGGFEYSESGGPLENLTISFGGLIGEVFDVSISLGSLGGGDKVTHNFDIPENMLPGYFKLWVDKTVEITPCIAYYRVGPGAPWEEVHKYVLQDTLSVTPSFIKVK